MIDILLLTLLAITAVGIVLLRDLFASVMLSAIFSLLTATLFVVMDAVDVAFTEVAVGGGVSTILMLSALNLTQVRESAYVRHLQPLPLLVVLLTGAVLAVATFDMPTYGDPTAPIHHHVADAYIKESYQFTHVPNIVTAILASYRGFDTLGEVAVIFTAAIGVMVLLTAARDPRDRDRKERR